MGGVRCFGGHDVLFLLHIFSVFLSFETEYGQNHKYSC